LKRRVRFEIGSLLFNLGALAAVLLAISAGASAGRLRPAADFLFVSSAVAIYVEAVVHLARRRARSQRGLEVPQGVLLRTPVWMQISETLSMVGIGATIGAVAAGAGFVSVGFGILLTFTAFCVAMQLIPLGRREDLTFEPEGLRVHISGASFLVPWDAITKVERGGSEDHRLIYVGIRDIRPVLSSLNPDTPQTRFRARVALGGEDGPAGRLTFLPWAAGLDGPVLARALNAAVERQIARAN
jgi:hypothetical protein